jgi:hypothetical protein
MADKTSTMAEGLGGGAKVSEAKPTVHSMHIHKAKNGHVVHHYHSAHHAGSEPDETHVVPQGPGGEGDLDNLHAHMEDHMGAPNAGEADLAPGVVGGPGAPPSAAPAGGAPPSGPPAAV